MTDHNFSTHEPEKAYIVIYVSPTFTDHSKYSELFAMYDVENYQFKTIPLAMETEADKRLVENFSDLLIAEITQIFHSN